MFDPRLPHGVSEVRGTRDPSEGRLVIHGWFVQPRPFVTGALSPARVAPALEEAIRGAEPKLSKLGPLQGALSVRLTIAPGGRPTRIETLTNNLMPTDGSPEPGRRAAAELRRGLLAAKFPRASGRTRVTVPVLFG